MIAGLRSDPYKKLRDLLAEARAAAKLTQLQVATRMNKPQSFVSKYERGERELDVIEFIAVCRAVGAEPSDLIEQLV